MEIFSQVYCMLFILCFKSSSWRACAKAIVRCPFDFKITAVCLRQRHDLMIFFIEVMIKQKEQDQSASLSLFCVVKLPKSKMQIKQGDLMS